MQAASLFFFFQAEDGIRGGHVTGVQTCALPISYFFDNLQDQSVNISTLLERTVKAVPAPPVRTQLVQVRSEERRVGKECGAGASRCQCKKQSVVIVQVECCDDVSQKEARAVRVR